MPAGFVKVKIPGHKKLVKYILTKSRPRVIGAAISGFEAPSGAYKNMFMEDFVLVFADSTDAHHTFVQLPSKKTQEALAELFGKEQTSKSQ